MLSLHTRLSRLLGGRLGRMFIAVTKGFADDAPLDAETIAAHWHDMRDDGRGYAIPANVAEQRGIDIKS